MSKEKSPAYQRYPRDILSDENYQAMNWAERGMYNHLMDLCWLETSISAELKILARILSISDPDFTTAWQMIGKCFNPGDDPLRLVHPRLDLERKKQAEHAALKARAGKKAMEKRWAKHKKPKPKITLLDSVNNRTITEDNSSSSSSFASSSASSSPIAPAEFAPRHA